MSDYIIVERLGQMHLFHIHLLMFVMHTCIYISYKYGYSDTQSDDRNDSNHCLTSGIRHSPFEWQRPQQLLPFTAAVAAIRRRVQLLFSFLTLCFLSLPLILLLFSTSCTLFLSLFLLLLILACSFHSIQRRSRSSNSSSYNSSGNTTRTHT